MNALPLDLLRDLAIFGGLSDDVLERLSRDLKTLRLDSGAAVFLEGDAAREMFAVVAGELEVLKKSRRGADTRLALLGPRDCFGEMSLIDIQPRSATVRCVSPAVLLRLGADDLEQIYRTDLRSYSIIVLNVARAMSRRLRVADAIVADFVVSVWDEYMPAPGSTKGR